MKWSNWNDERLVERCIRDGRSKKWSSRWGFSVIEVEEILKVTTYHLCMYSKWKKPIATSMFWTMTGFLFLTLISEFLQQIGYLGNIYLLWCLSATSRPKYSYSFTNSSALGYFSSKLLDHGTWFLLQQNYCTWTKVFLIEHYCTSYKWKYWIKE